MSLVPLVESLVTRYLAETPSLAAALAEHDVEIVVFEWNDGAAPLLDLAQAALSSAVDKAVEPSLFVAACNVSALVDAGFALHEDAPRVKPLVAASGLFLGYVAIGEGGVVYVESTGRFRWRPDAAQITALLREHFRRSPTAPNP